MALITAGPSVPAVRASGGALCSSPASTRDVGTIGSTKSPIRKLRHNLLLVFIPLNPRADI